MSHVVESWYGDTFLFDESDGLYFSLWSFSMHDKKATAFGSVRSEGATNAVFSPDGRWVAYQEIHGTRTEAYVQRFPPTDERHQVPVRRDNHHPLWSRDGKELYYVPGPDEYLAVSVTTAPSFSFGDPIPILGNHLLNLSPTNPRPYDVTRDGKFVGLVSSGNSDAGGAPDQINVVLNWFHEFADRVPAK